MAYRTEMSIPVSKDNRTFEQKRNDMVTSLEKSYRSTVTTSGSKTDKKSTTGSSLKDEMESKNVKWDSEVKGWIDKSRRNFSRDVERMRNDMFSLEPMDEFDLDTWGNFGDIPDFGSGDGSSMIDQMERRMQSVRQQMDSSMRSMGGSHFGGQPGSHSVVTNFSSSTQKSSTINEGGVVTESSSKSSESKKAVDGVSTSLKSHSSSTSTNQLGSSRGIGTDLTFDRPMGAGAIQPASSPIGGVMDFLKDAYEVGEDGQVHFKIRFDAKDFAPEDIDVSTVGNRLTVHASKTLKSATSSSQREFSRTVDLPQSIDHEKFQCSLTEDGVLILDAPVKAPDYKSITYDSDHNLGIRPKKPSEEKSPVVISGQSGPVVLNDGAGGRKLHLELPIDQQFSVDDICVRMDANKICISAKRDKKHDSSEGTIDSLSRFQSSESKEFSRTFEVPETIDPFTVTAVLKNNILVVEAPLLCTV